MKRRVVMKFGGTSVGTPEMMERTARLIVREKRRPVVVVSALGGVTNLLTEAGKKALKGEAYREIVEKIYGLHERVNEVNGLGQEIILEEFSNHLDRLLSGIELLEELSPRSKDKLLSLGERVSARLLAATLRKLGAEAKGWNSWDLGVLTDDRFNRALLLDEAATTIQEAFREHVKPKEIPVVTGFIGRSLGGDITTFGRGGSDFSAAIIGAALDVEEIQIWTDVPGFLRADPRVVGQADIIPAMRFDEAAELAYFGAKVLHPRTIEPARRKGIPVRILGSFHVDPDHPKEIYLQGTLIDDHACTESLRAIAVRHGVHTMHICSMRMLDAPGFLSRVFDVLARHQVSVDVVATSEVSVSMTFDDIEGDLASAIEEISAFAKVDYAKNRSILCLVGAGLCQDTSLLGKIFHELANHQVPLHVISQGASRINITFVTDPKPSEKAMQALHHIFFREESSLVLSE